MGKPLMQTHIYESKGRFKGILFGIALAIIVGLLFYTEKLVNDLRQEARTILQFYSRMYATAASDPNSDVDFIFNEIIERTYFPIISTNQDHVPTFWKGIGNIGSERTPENLERVNRIKNRMKTIGEPLPLTYEDPINGKQTLGYLYYGDSATITRLRWLPIIELGLVGLFILIGFIGFSTIKKSEERFLWVGMAKETAHQLGTPLSSLMGWIEVIREKSYKRAGTLKVIEEMEQDAVRLTKVAERFSQIGSLEDLRDQDINKILLNVARYIRRRLPQMQKKVTVVEDFGDIPCVPANSDLIEWVFENLVKNAVDSINHDHGLIRLSSGISDRKQYRIFVDVSDNGRGISPKDRKDIFRPGFSTKKRGWGLGLNLAKRIIEEYHMGKLILKDSQLDRGTIMRIYL
jgi:hypothetical protein